jgi:hypothetical protein
MIRCNCGETFETACDHAKHKLLKGMDHKSVCSICGKQLSSPISLDEAVIELADDLKTIIAVICLDCLKEI